MANRHDDEEDEEVEDEPESSRIISVLAETSRRDRWTVAPDTSMVTFLARSHFDFRQVEAEADTVELNIICVFGNVTIVVPEGTKVQLSGFSFLASANCDVASPEDAVSHLPKIVVNATTVFGRIAIRTPIAADFPPVVDATAVESSPSDAAPLGAAAPLGDEPPSVWEDASTDAAPATDTAEGAPPAESVPAVEAGTADATPVTPPVPGARAAAPTTPADAAELVEHEPVA